MNRFFYQKLVGRYFPNLSLIRQSLIVEPPNYGK